MVLRWQEVKEYVLAGMTDKEIAALRGYTAKYVGYIRCSIELPPNKKYKKKGN
jgi:hypothetical protein